MTACIHLQPTSTSTQYVGLEQAITAVRSTVATATALRSPPSMLPSLLESALLGISIYRAIPAIPRAPTLLSTTPSPSASASSGPVLDASSRTQYFDISEDSAFECDHIHHVSNENGINGNGIDNNPDVSSDSPKGNGNFSNENGINENSIDYRPDVNSDSPNGNGNFSNENGIKENGIDNNPNVSSDSPKGNSNFSNENGIVSEQNDKVINNDCKQFDVGGIVTGVSEGYPNIIDCKGNVIHVDRLKYQRKDDYYRNWTHEQLIEQIKFNQRNGGAFCKAWSGFAESSRGLRNPAHFPSASLRHFLAAWAQQWM